MARFETLIPDEEPTPEVEKPDPQLEAIRLMQESQAQAARQQAESQERLAESLKGLATPSQPAVAPRVQAPRLSEDDAVANPLNTMAQLAEYERQLALQEVSDGLSPVLNNMADGLYESLKGSLKESPFFKHAESELDTYFEKHPDRANKAAIREKFNSLIGQNYEKWQGQLETNQPIPRSQPDHSVRAPSPVPQAREEVEAKTVLDPETEDFYQRWTEHYPDMGMSRKEWKAIQDGKLFPGSRAKGR